MIIKHYFILLFIFLEGLSFLLLFQFNPYQKSHFVNLSRNLNAAVYGQIGEFRQYIALKEENEKLFLENIRLLNELASEKEVHYVILNDSLLLDTLVSLTPRQFNYIPAEVINNSVQRQYNYITLNKGSLQGIRMDMAVTSNGSVVGVVAGVSNNFSTVIPIVNKNFRVGASIAHNNFFGILEWDGIHPDLAKLREIPLHVEAKKGDLIITSGYSAIFPAGLSIGAIQSIQVTEGNFYDITVRLFTNFRNLKYVTVIENIYREEQKELERNLDYD